MGKLELVKEINNANSIVLVGHVSPDGDSIGSQLALAEGLESIGKSVSIQSHDPVPRNMLPFDTKKSVQHNDSISGKFDLIIFIECPVESRCGFTEFPAARKAGIDHHPDYKLGADANWLDASSASTAELIYQLLEAMEIEISKTMADALYLGIVTDTGRFVYPNTKPETLETAASLIRKGVRPDDIFARVFRSYPAARLDLRKILLSSLKRYFDDQVATMVISYKEIEKCDFSNELFDDLVNMPLEADEVKISVLARQTESGTWRFNLRSKGEFDIGTVAGTFNGGGHRNAAGFRSDSSIESSLEKLLPALESLVV